MDIAFLILDEADRMFDMGFYPDLRKLIRAVPPADRRQTMLFSATLNAWVKNLAWEYTRNPFEIAIEPETITVEEVEQILYHVSSGDKMKFLLGILRREGPESALIFCNTKRYAEIIAKRLRLNGYECEYIMGDLPQVKRLKIIDEIKAGNLRFLVATDVAARGLDIEGLAMVVNYDLPNEPENYVHRIGRTARAGKTGKAITLASEQDVYQLPAIERYIGRKIPSENAAEELLAEDKSEGKHVHTEFYEERSGHRTEGNRSPRKDHGTRRSDHRTEGHRTEGSRHDSKERHGLKDHEHGKHRTEKGRGGERGGHKIEGHRAGVHRTEGHRTEGRTPERETKSDVKLSELSLEERMAYYKQKYDRSGSVQLPRKETDQNEKKSGKKKRDKAGRGRNKVLEKPKQPQEQTAEGSASIPVKTDSGKGVLKKLLGLFRKKG
jgi:ATP-dependent RNA helicase RhlB